MKSVESYAPELAMSDPAPLPGRVHPVIAGGIGRVFGRLLARRERAAKIRALEELSDEILDDIGITRAELLRESNRTFWAAR